nr:MAG TPA: hypothetical protein [Caudoviricetes sp.]
MSLKTFCIGEIPIALSSNQQPWETVAFTL